MTWVEHIRDLAYPPEHFHTKWALRPRSIYCVTEGDDLPVKIGLSCRPMHRIGAMQGHTWRQLLVCWIADGHAGHEVAIKYLLRDRQCRGEWFHDPDNRLKALVSHGASAQGLEAAINKWAAVAGIGFPETIRMPALRSKAVFWRSSSDEAAA